jgi:hypothetical protein
LPTLSERGCSLFVLGRLLWGPDRDGFRRSVEGETICRKVLIKMYVDLWYSWSRHMALARCCRLLNLPMQEWTVGVRNSSGSLKVVSMRYSVVDMLKISQKRAESSHTRWSPHQHQTN